MNAQITSGIYTYDVKLFTHSYGFFILCSIVYIRSSKQVNGVRLTYPYFYAKFNGVKGIV